MSHFWVAQFHIHLFDNYFFSVEEKIRLVFSVKVIEPMKILATVSFLIKTLCRHMKETCL